MRVGAYSFFAFSMSPAFTAAVKARVSAASLRTFSAT
ncbi:Uncharacterised protein [Mycobacterium tuberculosis]|nr:Uncharacterised protein [Mycobacterium tuberculosis]